MDSDESINEENLLELLKPEDKQMTKTASTGTEVAKNMHPVVAQQLKQPRCKSSVWIYFERLDTTLAKCRICHNNYRFGSSISNLRHHAEVKHGEILRLGPVKFLELLKVPKEHQKVVIHPPRPPQVPQRLGYSSWTHRNKRRKVRKAASRDTQHDEIVKEEYVHNDTNSVSFDESDVNKALESIYQNSEDTINNYMESPSTNGIDSPSNTTYERLDSTNNDYTCNDRASENDELEIDFIAEPMNFNPLTNHHDQKFQRLREERMRAETNYFNKKATYMERNAEYVEAQRQHVLLQSKKLKMEIAAMRQSFQQT